MEIIDLRDKPNYANVIDLRDNVEYPSGPDLRYSLNYGQKEIAAFNDRVLLDSGTCESDSCSALIINRDPLRYITSSLFITPNGYKTSKLYSVVPADGTEDLTWVRNTTATRINSSGLIESVGANAPRLDYSGSVTCPAILVEPQRTNYILRSSEINNASWSKIRNGTGVLPAVTPDNIVSPDGTTNADTIVLDRGAGNTVSDYSWVFQAVTTFNGVYTVSFWIKASTISDVGKTLVVRLTPANINTSITVPLNWTRVTLTSTSSGVGAATALDIFNRGTLTTGNSVSFALWGVQVEIGSSVSSYIPTTSSIQTRNADVATVTTPAGITSLIETYEDNTTNVVNPIPVTYQMSKGRIAKVVGL